MEIKKIASCFLLCYKELQHTSYKKHIPQCLTITEIGWSLCYWYFITNHQQFIKGKVHNFNVKNGNLVFIDYLKIESSNNQCGKLSCNLCGKICGFFEKCTYEECFGFNKTRGVKNPLRVNDIQDIRLISQVAKNFKSSTDFVKSLFKYDQKFFRYYLYQAMSGIISNHYQNQEKEIWLFFKDCYENNNFILGKRVINSLYNDIELEAQIKEKLEAVFDDKNKNFLDSRITFSLAKMLWTYFTRAGLYLSPLSSDESEPHLIS